MIEFFIKILLANIQITHCKPSKCLHVLNGHKQPMITDRFKKLCLYSSYI